MNGKSKVPIEILTKIHFEFHKRPEPNTEKPVEGKDLVLGKEYLYIDNGKLKLLGNFVGKSNEPFDDSPYGYGIEIYYVFEYGVNKKKIRDWSGEEIFFYECD